MFEFAEPGVRLIHRRLVTRQMESTGQSSLLHFFERPDLPVEC